MTSLKHILLSLCLLLPLIGGAIYATMTDVDISASWSAESNQGAPSAAQTQEDLVAVRRAAGEASTQAGFLATGAQELADGVAQIGDQSQQLLDGIQQLQAGTQALANGMVQLQAGTGQLGSGATQLADGIDEAVTQVQSILSLQSAILAAMDDSINKLNTQNTPESNQVRDQIMSLREQVQNLGLDQAMTARLEEAKQGSRELANQLSTSGYAYHDGMYTATEGAKLLNQKVQEFAPQATEAMGALDQLEEGTSRINTMAQANKDKVTAVGRAIPAAQADEEGSEEGQSHVISPLYALLIGAMVTAIAALLGFGLTGFWQIVASLVVASFMGAVPFALFMGGFNIMAVSGAFIVLFIVALTSAVAAQFIMNRVGRAWGVLCSLVGILIQIGCVGAAWAMSATSTAPAAMRIISELMPLHYATMATTAIGNGVIGNALWMSLTVIFILCAAVCAVVGIVERKK